MKVLHVITTLGIGGAERYLLRLAPALAERGISCEVAFLKGASELREAFERRGIVVHDLSRGSWPARLAALSRRFAEGSYEGVHSHLLKANLLAERARPPHVFHVRGVHNDEAWLRRPLVPALFRRLQRRAGRVIVPTRHVGEFLARRGAVGEERIVVVPYGIEDRPPADTPARERERAELRERLGLEPDAFLVLCLARFAPQKGQRVWLRALDRAGVRAGIHLVFAGGDPWRREEPRFRADLERSAWRCQVHLIGATNAPERLLEAVDVLAVPSLWEGFGLVALEAMRAALPVVASDVPALREVLGSCAMGFLDVGDGSGWLSALEALRRDRAVAERQGARGRMRFLGGFTLDRMVDATLDVYRAEVAGR